VTPVFVYTSSCIIISYSFLFLVPSQERAPSNMLFGVGLMPGTDPVSLFPGANIINHPSVDFVILILGIDTRAFAPDLEPCPTPDDMKIDVQGGELDILKNGLKSLHSTLVIESEAEFVSLYENQPFFGDMQVFLRDHGFSLHGQKHPLFRNEPGSMG
jgi:hypothetical protein